MIKTTIDADVPFTVGPWEMLVVESTTITATSVAGCLAATAMREPVALIVRYPDGDRPALRQELRSGRAQGQPTRGVNPPVGTSTADVR